MLFFSDAQLIFDFELGESYKYIGGTCAFCKEAAVPNFFPNLQVKQGTIDDKDLEPGILYTMTLDQTLNFIRDWLSSVSIHKLFDWSAETWSEQYLSDVKFSIEKLDGDNCNDNSVFPAMKMHLAKNAEFDYKSKDRFIRITQSAEPEISWAIEDCLSCRLHGRHSEYEEYVNSIINKNAKTNAYFLNKFNLFKRKRFKKAKKYDIASMRPEEMELELFHSPYPNDRIRTCVNHIRKVLEAYRERL